MKTNQRARYATRLEKAIEYIQSRADGPTPTVRDIAKAANLSEYHFHRVYRLMTGETVGETLRRVRLAKAVPALSSSGSVESAAIASGYSSAQSFARAMRAQTGASPTSARQSSDLLTCALLRTQPAEGFDSSPAMKVDIVSLRPLKLLAIRNVGAYEELNSTFSKLFELVTQQVSAEAIVGLYAIQFDDPRFTPSQECRAICAVDAGDQGSPLGELEALTLGGQTYARLRHYGSYDNLGDSFDTLYAFTISTAGMELADAPTHINYLDDPEQVAEADLRCDLYLPLVTTEAT